MRLFLIVLFFFIAILYFNINFHPSFSEPYVYDPSLKVEKVYDGLHFPVSMSFLGPDDIIVLEKNEGTVVRITNGQSVEDPILELNVDSNGEAGLVGSTVLSNASGPPNVFLYFTEARASLVNNETEYETLGNRLYKYDFVNNTLVNPKLILDIPESTFQYHIGGKMVIGPDKNLYLAVGDLYAKNALTQNIVNGTSVDGSGGILRIDLANSSNSDIHNGSPSLRDYYAYGIRNSFGLDFDPLTGNLWDTENGPFFGDEINLVEPGFNSGWKKVQGIWEPINQNQIAGNVFANYTNLLNLSDNGSYSAPELSWAKPIGVTAIKFLNSSNLGKEYQNDMFVGDFNYGNIYHFELDNQRQKIIQNSTSIDNIETNTGSAPVFYTDPLQQCTSLFSCKLESSVDFSKNAREKVLRVSTPVDNKIWSWIPGKEFRVSPGNNYEIRTSMKLGETVNQSHIAIHGFNESTKLWEPLMSCPKGINGPTNWTRYYCNLEAPTNISKIKPFINGGYSAADGYDGVTRFNDIKITDRENNLTVDLFPELNFTSNIFGRGFGHISDIQVGPDGDLYILTVDPNKVEYLESYERHTASTGVIYKIVNR